MCTVFANKTTQKFPFIAQKNYSYAFDTNVLLISGAQEVKSK